ncbi:MAG: hypothetical protein PVI86_06000 [Phycisphaerae bacterium]|jgi:hypothetical protein
MIVRRGKHRRAVTLVELVAGLAISAVLITALASSLTLASRAIPDPQSRVAAQLDAVYATEQIAADLHCAQAFATTASNSVVFTVADRDPVAHAGPETIRYSWSGTPGDPLVWRYNTDSPVDLVEDVQEFTLTYDVDTVTETTIAEVTTLSDEIVLAHFDGWTGLTPTAKQLTVNDTNWASQYFEYIAPAGASALIFTRAVVMMSSLDPPPSTFNVAIHRSLKSGQYLPDAEPIGTPATVLGADVPKTTQWTSITFADVTVSDPAREDYCLVFQGKELTPVYLHHYWNRNALSNKAVLRWTANGGGSWSPTVMDYHKNDLRFYVYGQIETKEDGEVSVDKYYLRSVRIALRLGSHADARVETAIPVLNAPEVTP